MKKMILTSVALGMTFLFSGCMVISCDRGEWHRNLHLARPPSHGVAHAVHAPTPTPRPSRDRFFH